MENSAILRSAMIEGQIKPNKVTDPRVLAALSVVPRDLFVPKAMRSVAYIDEDLEIALGRYLMEPMVFARLLNEAAVTPEDLVLDIGGGTGYSSAIFGQLASAVIALESDADMARTAREILPGLEIGNVAIVEGDLMAGHPKDAPYDVIFINGAVEEVPQALIDQLAEGGRLLAVLMENGVGRGVVGRKSGGFFGLNRIMEANVPILPGFTRPKKFEF